MIARNGTDPPPGFSGQVVHGTGRWPASASGIAAACVVALLVPSVVTWAYFVHLAGDVSRAQQLAFGVGKTLQFLWPLVWTWWFDRSALVNTSWRHIWQTRRGLGLGTAIGLAVALAMFALYWGWLLPQGEFAAAGAKVVEKVRGFGVATPASYFVLAAFYAVCHAGLEEYYWRWFVFGQLRRIQPWGRAAIISSLGFMAHHVIILGVYFGWSSPWTYFFSLSVAVGGLLWAWLYQRSGSLLGPWLSHSLVDAAIFCVGYDIVREIFPG